MEERIRLAREEDSRALAKFGRLCWEAAYRGLMPDALIDGLTVERREAGLRRRRREADPERRQWILERGRDLLGYCSSGPVRDADGGRSVCGEIYSLYVHPERWERGHGTRLLQHVLADLRARGYDQVALWCLTTNPRARRFYEHHGFAVEVEERSREFDGYPLPHTRYRRLLGEVL